MKGDDPIQYKLMKMEEEAKDAEVLPHEHTLDGPKKDRMNLMKEVF